MQFSEVIILVASFAFLLFYDGFVHFTGQWMSLAESIMNAGP